MKSFDEQIILRYLEGKASEEEILQMEEWIGSSQEHRDHFYRISDLYHSGEVLTEGRSGIRKMYPVTPARKEGAGLPRRVREVIRIAAVVVVTAGITWGVFGLHQNRSLRRQSVQVIRVPAGSVATVLLPDSTKVWLNAESSLTYDPAVFGKKSRDVTLTGEAYFDVTHNRKKQFVVNASTIRIRVFGTRFNVKAYPEDATVETTLEEGKIELEKISGKKAAGKTPPVILKPEQRAVLVKNEGRLLLSDVIPPEKPGDDGSREISVKSGKILVADKVDTRVYTSWKDGRLIIRGEPLEHLAKKLERRYDVHIVFRDNEAGSLRFTGILENETLEQVLYAIQLTSPIRYTIDHKTVYLEKIN